MSSRTAPYDLTHIRGYPDTLQIYRIGASRFWQVRLFVRRKYLRKSTKTDNKAEAIEFAKRLFDEVKIAERLDVDIHPDTFAACAKHLMHRQEALVGRDERDSRIISEDQRKLNKDILPWFGTKAVKDITTEMIDDYVDELSRQRKLSPSTLNKHLIVIRKVLNEARRRGYLRALPIIPTVKKKDNPRSFFTEKEYRKLWETARRLAKENIKVRYVPLTEEMWDLIVFSVNVFVRLSDIKVLKHKHVQVVREDGKQYLLITPTSSKTVNRESASMKAAVDVYERLVQRHRERGFGEAEDYVFFPEHKNREYALQTMRRQFEFIVDAAGLRTDARGRVRTLYSLRHTALMFRLLHGKSVDIFLLARNALTSVDQLERFYLSHYESRTRIEELQAYRK